ncbi:MAG: FAD-binding oxidoreductase [Anaerolineales bacterium]
MKLTPLWTEQFQPDDVVLNNDLPMEAEVAVVGSGYTGLNAAIEMGKAGIDVVVLEQETIGWGASSRNGTMLTPGLKAKQKDIKRWYGAEKQKELWQWSVDAVNHVTNIIQEEQIDCDYSINGMAYLATKPSHAEMVRSYGEFLDKEFGYKSTQWIPADQIEQEIGSKVFYGALIDNLGSRLQPAKYVGGLAKAAQNYGVKLVNYSRVEKITRLPGKFTLNTGKGILQAKKILLATGGYTTNLVPKVKQGIFPVGSYIIVTEPLPESLQKELSPKNRVFYDSKIFLNYFCLTPDGRMMLGGRANLSPNLDLQKSSKLLHDRLVEIFPQLSEIPITHSWTGKLGISFDQMPHIGNLDGIYYAYGYSGHGISIGSYLGKEVGELISGKKKSSVFMEIHHPKYIFASLSPMYLPFVSTYFKIKDQLS